MATHPAGPQLSAGCIATVRPSPWLMQPVGLQLIFKKAIRRKFSPDSLLSLEQNLSLDIIFKN